MAAEAEAPQGMTAPPVQERIEVLKDAIRRRDLATVAALRGQPAIDPALAYLLTLTVDIWKHPGRMPALEAYAASDRELAPTAAEMAELLRRHAFAGRDAGYVGGTCHQPHDAGGAA